VIGALTLARRPVRKSRSRPPIIEEMARIVEKIVVEKAAR
jgi:hypothetical protein